MALLRWSWWFLDRTVYLGSGLTWKSSSRGVVGKGILDAGWREKGSLGYKDWRCGPLSKPQKVSLFFSLSFPAPSPLPSPFPDPLLPPIPAYISVYLHYVCLHKFTLLVTVSWDDCYDSWGNFRSALHCSNGPVLRPNPGVTLVLERQRIRPSSCHDLFLLATLLKASQGLSTDC